jgi:hypothetical protein
MITTLTTSPKMKGLSPSCWILSTGNMELIGRSCSVLLKKQLILINSFEDLGLLLPNTTSSSTSTKKTSLSASNEEPILFLVALLLNSQNLVPSKLTLKVWAEINHSHLLCLQLNNKNFKISWVKCKNTLSEYQK